MKTAANSVTIAADGMTTAAAADSIKTAAIGHLHALDGCLYAAEQPPPPLTTTGTRFVGTALDALAALVALM